MTDSKHRAESTHHTSLLVALAALLVFCVTAWSQDLQTPRSFRIEHEAENFRFESGPRQIPNLRIGHRFAPGTVQFENLMAFQRQLREKNIANLRLSDRPTPDAADESLIRAARSDKLDLAVVPFREVIPFAPRFAVFELPFLFRSDTHVSTVMYYLGADLLNDLRDIGLVGIGWWPGEFLVLASRKVVLEPDDLRGMKMVTAQNLSGVPRQSHVSEKLFEQLGARVLQLQGAELRRAWQEGGIDIVEGTLQQIRPFNVSRLSVTYTNHLYEGFVVVASPGGLGRLPARKRDALLEALQNQFRFSSERLRDAQRTASKELEQEKQASIFKLTETEHLAWYDRSSSPQLIAQVGPEFVKQVIMFGYDMRMTSAGPRSPVISWNTWLEDNQGQDVAAPAINNVYRVNLDMARYAYSLRHSAGVSHEIINRIKKSGKIELLLQPVVTGVFMPAPGTSLKPQKLKINLERTLPQDNDDQLLKAFDKGKISTRKLSEAVNLGASVSWQVVARKAGCGSFAVSVWDDARIAPLDHVVFSFAVRAPEKPEPQCSFSGSANAMRAGLETLLTVPGQPNSDATQTDAALHIFEFKDADKTRSVVVFADRAGLAAAKNDSGAADAAVFAWTTESQISKYVTGPSGLPVLISEAHESIGTSDDPYRFEEVAQELAITLFGGETDTDRDVASRALKRLKEIVAAEKEPSIMVSVVSESGKALYIPVGLLAARAKEPVLPQRLTVIQPLTRWAAAPKGCIDTWRVARPRSLEYVRGDAIDLLEEAAERNLTPGIKEVLPNHDALVRYFKGGGEDRGEGIIIVAHHHEGRLWFGKDARPPMHIRRERIQRRYAPGSVALLAACATTGVSEETSAIIDKLISCGINAMIISPFAVDAAFGTRLALEFEQAVAEARTQHRNAKLGELFETAIARVTAAAENRPADRDMALEFMVVGNPDLRLCK